MSLWSSTNIQADDDCGRQGIWLRLGKKGVSWDGYRVGSWVHDYIHAHAVGAAKPKLGELSVLEQQDAKKCLYNFREMGLLDAPEGAVWEQSYIGLVNSDGSVYGWADAPSTAIRGEDWDPASFTDETWVRIQPDRHWLDTTNPDEPIPTGDDWKTALSMGSEGGLDYKPQPILYGAFLADHYGVPDDRLVRMNFWFLRHPDNGLAVEREAGWFRRMSKRLLAGCWERDQIESSVLESSLTGGEHCSRCPYRGLNCLGTQMEHSMPLEARWRAATRMQGMAAAQMREAKAAMKARTSRLELADGTVLGPLVTRTPRFSLAKADKVKVSQGLEVVARWALQRGDFHSLFKREDKMGALPKWLGKLGRDDWVAEEWLPDWYEVPEDAQKQDGWVRIDLQSLFDGLTKDYKKTIYIKEPKLQEEVA